MKKDITELYCFVEDFCRVVDENFANRLLSNGKKPTRVPGIVHSEILTIILLYHQSPCKNFKVFYLCYLQPLYKSEFSKLPSYHSLKAAAFMVFSTAFTMALWAGKNDRNFIHRCNIDRCLPSKKNIEKQSFQWISRVRKNYLRLVFWF